MPNIVICNTSPLFYLHIPDYEWIEVRPVRISELVRLITDLGPGESQVLALALEEPNCRVILDDRLAREIAELQHLRITGTAGVLLKAKQRGYIPAIKPLLDQLNQLHFHLSVRR